MLKYIDLFSGLGGWSAGLKNFNFLNCILAIENNKEVVDIYKTNFKNKVLIEDIRNVDEKEVPPFDLLVGSPPCQSFSIAGLKKGFNDPRGTLFLEVFRFINYHKPKLVVLENVPHLLHVQNKIPITTITENFKNSGYKLKIHNLLASEYGIAQARKRLYFVAIRDDIQYVSLPPQKINKPVLTSKYLLPDSEVGAECYASPERYTPNLDLETLNIELNLIKANPNYFNKHALGLVKDHKNRDRRVYSVFAPSVCETYGKRHPYYTAEGNVRYLSIEETKNIMGFNNYKLPSELKYRKYLGNAVLPQMVKLIFENIKCLDSLPNEE